MSIIKQKSSPSSQKRSRGFTLVEIMVIAPIVILVIGAFVAVALSMTGEVLTTRSSDTLLYKVQDALDRISTDVRSSSNFLATNNVTLTSPQGIDNSTGAFYNVSTSAPPELILDTAATTANPSLTTSQPVYLTNSPNACNSSSLQQNSTLHVNVVYFISGGSLWRRVISNSNYLTYPTVVCSMPWQRASCAPSVSGTMCATKDEELISNTSSLTMAIKYYATPNDTAENTVAAATSSSISDRNDALKNLNTIAVTLSASNTVAGRDFTRTATAKATRASTISAQPNIPGDNTVPSAPVISSSYDPNIGVTFKWPMVSPAATYQIQYKFGSGSWVAATPSSTTDTFYVLPMTSIYNGETIAVQVVASTKAGSSTAGTASITTPVWNRFDYINGWLDYNSYGNSGYANGSYTKTSAGIVVMRGLIRNTFSTGTGTIAVLPQAYRPAARLLFSTSSNLSGGSNTVGRVDIDSDGSLISVVGDPTWLSVDGMAYLPAAANGGIPTTAVATFSNGWVNYNGGYLPLQYATDGAGRTVTEGLVANGTLTDGTLIAALPTSILPSLYMHVAQIGGANGASMMGIDNGVISASTFGLVAKGTATNSFLSTNALFFPSSYASWSNLILQNGWVAYGGSYSTPQYTKGSDGVVSLKGLIKAGTGTSGTIITTLPAGYRPSARLLYGTVSGYQLYTRFDILPTGDIMIVGTANNGWLSLDDIHFLGEQ